MKRTTTIRMVQFLILGLVAVIPYLSASAQSELNLSKNADFSTEDRDFLEGETIFMRVFSEDVDFSSVRVSEFYLRSQEGEVFVRGEFENHFDGSFTSEISVDEIDLVEHMWEWEGFIEDAAGNRFQSRVYLRLGNPEQVAGLEIRAAVDEVGPDYLMLKGQKLLVSQETEIVVWYNDQYGPDGGGDVPYEQGTRISLEEIQPGFGVLVRAGKDDAGNLVARRVGVQGPVFAPAHVELGGRIQSVDETSGTFKVRDITIQFQEGITFIGGEDFRPDEQGLKVGQLVQVFGEFDENQQILAHYVDVRRALRPELEVSGRIRNFDGTRFTVQGFPFALTDGTRIESEFGGTDPADGPDGTGSSEPQPEIELRDGMVVRVVGAVDGQNLVADHVMVRGGEDRNVRVGGAIEELTETGFFVQGWEVVLDEYAGVFDEKFEQVTRDALVEGQLVMVFGEFTPDGSIRGFHVEFRRPERDEFVLRGPVRFVDGMQFGVWDVQFTMTDQTVIEGDAGNVLSPADLEVGQFAEVISVPDARGTYIVERVFLPRQDHGGLRMVGAVELVSLEEIVVQGRTLMFAEHTQFWDQNWNPIESSQLAEGAVVELFASNDEFGFLVAHEVRLTFGDREETEVWGVVDEVNGDLLVVGGIEFVWTANSVVHSDNPDQGEPSFADIAPGQAVSVTGFRDDAGMLLIEWVHLRQEDNSHLRISGTIESIDANGMSLWGQYVQFVPETQFYDAEYLPVTASDLQAGQVVNAFGRTGTDGQIVVDYVEVKNGEKPEVQYSGRLDQVEGNALLIGGSRFIVTDATQIFFDEGPNDEPSTSKKSGARSWYGVASTLDQLAPGMFIEVLGTPDPTGNLVAVFVQVRRKESYAEISGQVQALEPAAFMLQGQRVEFGPEAQLFNENFEPLPLESLVEGQGILVKGEMRPDGVVIAFELETKANVDPKLQLNGDVQGVQDGFLVVQGVTFVVNEFTRITSQTGEEMPLSMIQFDQRVHVAGGRDPNGALVAFDVFVERNVVNVWMRGAIAALQASEMEVNGSLVRVSEFTNIQSPNFEEVDFSFLQVDQNVFLWGELAPDGLIEAFGVEVQGGSVDEIELFGALGYVQEGFVGVNGRDVEVGPNTYIVGPNGGELAVADLLKGMAVSVVAKPSDTGGLLAKKIFVDTREDQAGVRMRGEISGVTSEGFSIQGLFVRMDEASVVYNERFEPIDVLSLTDGQQVQVFGRFTADGSIIADQVETTQKGSNEVGVQGTITEASPDGFEAYGVFFQLKPETYLESAQGFPISPEEIMPGEYVEANGYVDADGVTYALWVRVGGQQFVDRGAHLAGRIDDIDRENRIVFMQGRKIRVDEFAEVVNVQFERMLFVDLEPGMSIRAFGEYREGEPMQAFRIELRGAENVEIELRGPIEAIDGEVVVVRGMPFVVTDNTFIDDGSGTPAGFTSLEEGVQVGVIAVPGSDGSYLARSLFVTTGDEDRSFRIAGVVRDLDEQTKKLVIRNRELLLQEHVEVVGPNFEPIRLEEVKLGQFVVIWGWINDRQDLEVYRVELHNVDAQLMRVIGLLTDKDAANLYVRDLPFAVSDKTLIAAPEVGRLSFEELFEGMVLGVEAVADGDQGLRAVRVEPYGLDPFTSIEVEGVVETTESGGFAIGGIPFRYDASTLAVDGNWRRVAASNVEVGSNVNVGGFVGSEGGFEARFLQIFDIVQDEKTFVGRIDEITSTGALRIRDHVVLINDETVILDLLDNVLTFEDLAERMRVEIRGIITPSGFLAQQIRWKPRDRKLTGTLEAIDSGTLTVAGLEISINNDTEFLNAEGEEVDSGELAQGVTVNVLFTPGAGGLPIATRVTLLPRIEDEVVLNGTVEAYTDDLMVVLGRRFQVLPNTQLLDENGNRISLTDFTVGEAVRMRALLLAGDNLVALKVKKLGEEVSDIRVEGPIVSVNSSTLEVMGIFFFLNDESQFFDLERNEVSATDLAVGQTVAVIGEGQSNGTVVGRRVLVQNVSLTSGELSEVTANTFSMFGNDYRIDDNTLVLGDENAHLDLTQLEDGQYVEVRGVVGDEGSVAGKNGSAVLVSKIKIIDAEGLGDTVVEENPTNISTEDEVLPQTYTLEQNYPNPFNPVTTIRFTVPELSNVELKVFDVTGREVQTLVAGSVAAGTYEVEWNGRNSAGLPVASGVYLYRMQVEGRVITRRMVLLK